MQAALKTALQQAGKYKILYYYIFKMKTLSFCKFLKEGFTAVIQGRTDYENLKLNYIGKKLKIKTPFLYSNTKI